MREFEWVQVQAGVQVDVPRRLRHGAGASWRIENRRWKADGMKRENDSAIGQRRQ